MDEEELQRQEEEEIAAQEEQEEWEEMQANQLAEAQFALRKQAESITAIGASIGSPSMTKWGIIFFLALVNDVIDILTFTGIGEILAWSVSIFLTALILLIMWFSDGPMKNAHEFASKIGDEANQAQLAIQVNTLQDNIKDRAGSIAKTLNKIPGFRNVKVGSSPRKNPLSRLLWGSAFESLPFLGALNFITVWAVLAYLAEKHAFDVAKQSADEASQQVLANAQQML